MNLFPASARVIVFAKPSTLRLAAGMPRYADFELADGHLVAGDRGHVLERENCVTSVAPGATFHVMVEPAIAQLVDPATMLIEPWIVEVSMEMPATGLNVDAVPDATVNVLQGILFVVLLASETFQGRLRPFTRLCAMGT